MATHSVTISSKGDKKNIHNIEGEQQEGEEGNYSYLGFLNNCTVYKSKAQRIIIKVDNKNLEVKIDTGACESVANRKIFEQLFKKSKIIEYNRIMKLISGQTIKTFGKVEVDVVANDTIYKLELTILDTYEDFVPLLGRNWLDVLFPTWRNLLSSSTLGSYGVHSLTDVNNKYDIVFSKSNSAVIKDFKAEFVLKENSVPIFCKPSVVPYGLKSKVEEEIKRLCDEGVLIPAR